MEAREEIEQLMQLAFEIAIDEILQNDGFQPFALSSKDGEKELQLINTEGVKEPEVEVIVKQLRDRLLQGASQARFDGVALAFDARVKIENEFAEVILVEFDHRHSTSMTVVLPYQGRGVLAELGEYRFSLSEHVFFEDDLSEI